MMCTLSINMFYARTMYTALRSHGIYSAAVFHYHAFTVFIFFEVLLNNIFIYTVVVFGWHMHMRAHDNDKTKIKAIH